MSGDFFMSDARNGLTGIPARPSFQADAFAAPSAAFVLCSAAFFAAFFLRSAASSATFFRYADVDSDPVNWTQLWFSTEQNFALRMWVSSTPNWVLIAVTLFQWIGIFLNSISGVAAGILAFLFVLTGTASLIFGLASGPEFLKMMIAAFAIFLIPHIGNWLIERIILLRCLIGDFIRS